MLGPEGATLMEAMQNACFPEDPWDAALIARLLALPGTFALAADGADGQPAGFALVRVAADEAEILAIGVLPDARRQGLGRVLVDALARAAGTRGADRVFLEVAEDNLAARALYASEGFDAVGRRPGYYRRNSGPNVAALILRRPLASHDEAE
jgi:ribosomal-protein-alanine N-acetyltransferase